MSLQIFCDFDGTITNNDNIVAIMKKFAPPEAETIKQKILLQEISIQEGVGEIFSLLPTSLQNDITTFIKETAVIRDGFQEFAQFVQTNQISLHIISGGMDFFVYPLLKGLINPDHIYCNTTDFSGETIQINWPHPCGEHCKNKCGLCKSTLIRQLSSNGDFNIVIGDSITDLQAAKLADKVFARDFLITKCEEHQISYTAFETFYDIQAEVKQLLEVIK
ncbi:MULTISPECIES: 2-hydroxy-3-keto-5-methylthiopentenyl-1-phosphate phosphatase [Bacillus cereus group]|uniref:2-hydroxy-3-keto-5-methylthiopentenyl-1-phosphate phosphatase n=1 Tax=Bacillus cereus TaxID=1396 RepID=A0AA44Q9K5_BACCE|nr:MULTISPECIES: 2-hydroxy-3-keto-5-methylthiopentenyl-1-phosphate phosphatase [Bacillus cereus group]PFA24132.1 2-hydroxy-3-keto-5-methylthiopentenyl-1-phosphate phosphatase [Bacillus cereus]PFN09570.1 2-hydroxy-3-keto-5-methylthiopentenyl-1-phosphate phosphatase [Bacillus cereus]PFO81478.1 2-hydroxy-3-keto-5-methylthiopentenyl-1-phosphate phosphatase [Bacillus cereus]PFR25395.1 2-hydroxy-3-keto-5-methylthiopentenyl-1-phosphate phosphatase [Bacillus cereus]PFR99761.1 2-hydroxy-3-keto-5-methyl